MNKAAFILMILSFFATTGSAQSVYTLAVKTINGDSVRLDQYAGKKILFILAPFNRQDSIYQQLSAFKIRYADTIQVIGIPAIEDGYQPGQATALAALYSNTGIVLTEGTYTRKTSGNRQSPLLQWLTDVTKNRHFNNDAVGIGQKFFVSETGRLFAVLGPRVSLQSPLINRVVNSASR